MTQHEEYAPSSTRAATPGLLEQTWLWLGTVLILSAALIAVWLWGLPGDLLHKADLVGYAICHRIPERSFVIGGRHLPLCARCMGIYLGVWGNLIVMTLLKRGRSAELPRPAILAVLMMFVVLMGIDGLNSYMTFFPGAPHLYEPRNELRLFSGMLHGVTLSSLVYPLLNQTLWADVEWAPALRNFRELALVLLTGALGAGLTLLRIPALLYPLAFMGSCGVLVMLAMINSVIVVTILRRENRATVWWQAIGPLAVGVVLALLQVSFLDMFRAYITQAWNLPF